MPGRIPSSAPSGLALTAKVRMSNPRRGPCGEIGLRSDVGDVEVDIAVECGHIAAQALAHSDLWHQRLLDVERHPHVAHVEDGDHGITAAHQLALLGDDRRDFARNGRIDHRVAQVALHLRYDACGLPHLCRGGGFLLLRGAVDRQVVLRLGGRGGRGHGVVLRLRLVEFLRRHDPLFVERFHAVEGLLGQFASGLRLLPHVERRFDLLHAGAGEHFLVDCRRCAPHRFGLLQFGVQFGRGERV